MLLLLTALMIFGMVVLMRGCTASARETSETVLAHVVGPRCVYDLTSAACGPKSRGEV